MSKHGFPFLLSEEKARFILSQFDLWKLQTRAFSPSS